MEKTPQGLTNKIVLQNGVMTKISSPEVDYFLNREGEASLYQQLKNKGSFDFILEPLDWGFDEKRIFYSQWKYDPKAYTLIDKPELLDDPKVWDQMINVVNDYHQISVETPLFQPKEYLNKFLKKIKTPLVDLSHYENALNKIIDDYYTQDFEICLSHNDMVPGNFLFSNGNLKLIDFEYSIKNIFLFDYAGMLTETIPEKYHEQFIQKLNLSQEETKKLYDLMLYAYFLWINWSNYMFEVCEDKVYQDLVEFMNKRLQNFVQIHPEYLQ